jgi:LPS sulfotransferase NodH
MTKYVIFGLPRTGSSLLGELLAAQPASAYDTELLHAKFWLGWRRPLYRLLRIYPYPYLDYRRARASIQGEGLYGFKLFPRHVRAPRATLLGLHRRQWRILHIQRRDLFHQVLSVLVAAHTGRYDGDHADAPPRLYLDPTTVADKLCVYRQKRQEIEEMLRGIEHLDVVYEDDLLDCTQWDATLERIAAAWGIRIAPAQTAYRKTWPQPYSELVVNYAELRQQAEGAPS